jgi:hypothetical protein
MCCKAAIPILRRKAPTVQRLPKTQPLKPQWSTAQKPTAVTWDLPKRWRRPVLPIADHTKAADSLKAIAQKENITLPDSMDAVHKQKYTEIQEMSGDNFNKAYVMLMVADHKGAVNLLQNESQNGKDPALKGLATKILPTVQGHLDMANKLQAGMK